MKQWFQPCLVCFSTCSPATQEKCCITAMSKTKQNADFGKRSFCQIEFNGHVWYMGHRQIKTISYPGVIVSLQLGVLISFGGDNERFISWAENDSKSPAFSAKPTWGPNRSGSFASSETQWLQVFPARKHPCWKWLGMISILCLYIPSYTWMDACVRACMNE